MVNDRSNGKGMATRNLWWRRLLALFAAIIAYRFLLWAIVGLCYDEDEFKHRLKEWAHALLATDADTARVTIGINASAMVKINAHGCAIASPNPLFPREMLRSDPVTLSCPLWGIWGLACHPTLELSAPVLYGEWGTPERGCNFDGLADNLHSGIAPQPFPLRYFRPGAIAVTIKAGKMILRRAAPAGTLETAIESRNFICDLRKAKAHGSLQPAQIVFWHGDKSEPLVGQIHIDRFTIRPTPSAAGFPLALSELRLKAERLPLKCLAILWPDLPTFDNGDYFSGVACVEDARLQITGKAATALNAILGFGATAPLRLHCLLDGSQQEMKILLGNNDEATVAIESRGAKWPARLTLRCPRLNLTSPTERSGQAIQEWLRWLGQRECRLAIRTDILACPLAEIKDAQADALLGQEGCQSLIAQGLWAGGTCRIQAAAWPADSLVPERFACEIEGADAAVWLANLAAWLPQPLQARIMSGRVNFSLRHSAAAKSDDAAPVTLSCHFKALALAREASGEIWRQIFAIPRQLLAAEALIRKARAQPPPKEEKSDLEALAFSELTISAAVEKDGSGTFEIHGRSPQLGRIDGLGRREANGDLRGALALRELPATFAGRVALSEETCEALARQSEEGLRLDFSLQDGKPSVEHRYVQDIFRLWAESAGKAEDGTLP